MHSSMQATTASRILAVGFFLVLASAWPAAATPANCADLFHAEKNNQKKTNPLLEVLTHRDQPIRFDMIEPELFDKAFPEALQISRQQIDAVKTQTSRADFSNTIEALDRAVEQIEIVSGLLHHYVSVQATPRLQEIFQKWVPAASELENSIVFDQTIFARVKDLYERRESLSLTPEQTTILSNVYRKFVSNGANLSNSEKTRVSEIDTRLSGLTQKFGQNLTTASAEAKLVVTDEASLVGLPAHILAPARELANSQGLTDSWVFRLKGAVPSTILTRAENRDLRQQVWTLLNRQNIDGPYDNRALVLEIVKLRQEKAQILGFRSHADLTTKERMAKNPEAVMKFIEDMASEYKPGAIQDAKELQDFATTQGSGKLAYWDIPFYVDKLRKERYAFDSEEVRPYLTLDAVHKGALKVAERLFDIEFIADPSATSWAPEVRAYRVMDKKNGAFIGFFYFDPFTRDGKQPGAWMNSLISAGEWAGEARRPHILNVMNFAPPAKGSPALISLGEARTIFHELGHGLHGLFSQTRYRVTASPQIAWDVVELPSQLFESWLKDPATLRSFAKHHETGEPLPFPLIEKIKRAENFRIATSNLGSMRMAAVDMAWYFGDGVKVKTPNDILDFEKATTAPYAVYPPSGALISPTFGHIFSGGYSAGYYSYKWADVLVADAWELFEQTGIYNRKTATRFRDQFLSRGSAEEASVLYENFRGRPADSKAVLRREGLIPPQVTP